MLQTSLAKLDLVTREEFEVQEAVLAKTRSKLEALEARLAESKRTNVGARLRRLQGSPPAAMATSVALASRASGSYTCLLATEGR